jgi:hypothetical protein
MKSQPLDGISLWAIYPLALILILAATAGGYWYATSRKRKAPEESAGILGPITGATLGLLAFLMAFVLAFGVNVAQERRALVVADANAIRDSYLRAGYIDEPYRTQARGLLLEYLDLRVAALDPQKRAAALARSEQINQELWSVTETFVGAGNTSDVSALFVESVNNAIDVYHQRVNLALNIRTPPLIIIFTLIFTVLAMFLVGMQAGYAKGRRVVALVVMAIGLAAVLYLIVDLDRAQQGLIQVTQQPILHLQAEIRDLP